MSNPAELPASQVALLYRVSSVVSSALNLEQMLQALVQLAAEVTRCDACLVYLPDSATGEVVLRASLLPHTTEIGKVRMKAGEGVTGWVAEHRSVVALVRNAYSDARFKRFPTLVEDTYEACLSVPLISGGEVIGVINIHHKNEHVHAPEEIALITFLGEQMGGAIAKAQLAEQRQRLEEELESRKVVERAKGILQRNYQLTEEEAYLRLRNESRRTRRPMRDLASAIILAEGLRRGDAATEGR